MSKYYRYEFIKDDYKKGILTGLDDFFTIDEICSVCGIFETCLKCPTIDMRNTKSYFTERGNRKFRKMIRTIEKMAKDKNIKVNCEVVTLNNEKILYKDNYQIVIPA